MRLIQQYTMATNVRCTETGKTIKKELAEESDDWVKTEDGWLSPHANPDSDKSW